MTVLIDVPSDGVLVAAALERSSDEYLPPQWKCWCRLRNELVVLTVELPSRDVDEAGTLVSERVAHWLGTLKPSFGRVRWRGLPPTLVSDEG